MVQRKDVRFIHNSYNSSTQPSLLMGNNNIMTLEKRRQIARLKFLFSLFSHQFNINPEFYIQPRLSRRTRCTHKRTLTLTFARTNLFKYSFFPRSIDEWKVPAEVFSARDVSHFGKIFISLLQHLRPAAVTWCTLFQPRHVLLFFFFFWGLITLL